MVRHEEAKVGPEVKPIPQPAATTPAIVGICLGAGLFLVGVVAVTLFFYRRKSFGSSGGYRKGGVYLSRHSPVSQEHIPLHGTLCVTRRDNKHLRKTPSPPLNFTSPKNASPLSPPTDQEGEYGFLLSSPKLTPRHGGIIGITAAEVHSSCQARPRGSSPSPLPSSQSYGGGSLQQPKQREKSPRVSPLISPSDSNSSYLDLGGIEAMAVMNQRNGNNSASDSPVTPSPNTPIVGNVTGPVGVIQGNSVNNTPQVLTGGGLNSLGILHFRIRYKAEKGALIVSVVKCEDLPVKDTTLMTCDPYVKLQILPEKQQRVKTRVLRHTRQPVYEEDFTFFGIHSAQLETITLHFVVLSFDRYSRDDVIGEVFCPLSSVKLPETDNHQLEVSRDIQPRNLKMRSQGRGEVLLSLCWQPSANRLTVVVLKARNLPKMDVTGLADPYVKMYLLYDGQRIAKKKTHIKKRTLNPVFNESFVFDLPPPPTGVANNLEKVSLQLSLLDWDRVTKNEVIGRLELGEGTPVGTTTHHWEEVVSCPRRQIAEWHKLRD